MVKSSPQRATVAQGAIRGIAPRAPCEAGQNDVRVGLNLESAADAQGAAKAPAADTGKPAPDTIHVTVEAMKLALADRGSRRVVPAA
jgi:hypothetical protein